MTLLSKEGQATATGQQQAAGQQGGQQQQAVPQHVANDKGEFRDGWMAILPEDMREAPSLKNFKSVEGMAKSLLSAQRMVGADKVALLTDASSDEDRNEFFRKVGRPDKPEGYEFKKLDESKMPKGLATNREFESAFANKAFELGLSKEQANKLRDWHNDIVLSSYKDADTLMDEQYDKAMSELQKEWGNASQANIDLANKVVVKFDPENKLIEQGLGNNPVLVRMFAQIGKMFSEDSLVVGEASKTPSNAQSRINDILGDKKHPYFVKDHPKHQEAVAEVAALFSQKNPVLE